jgi:hypothetical protein
MCIWCASLLSQICQGNVANYCALSAKEARYRLFRFEFAAHMDLITHWAVQLNFVPQSIIIQNLRGLRDSSKWCFTTLLNQQFSKAQYLQLLA